MILMACEVHHISLGPVNSFKSEPCCSVSFTLANYSCVCFWLVCFKISFFFSILLTPYEDSQSIKRVRIYPNKLLITSCSFSQGSIQLKVVVYIFMSLGWDKHSTITARFFQYLLKIQRLVCIKIRERLQRVVVSNRQETKWMSSSTQPNTITHKISVGKKFLEIKMHIRTLI